MKTIKKVLKVLWYILYVIITNRERLRYAYGKRKGMHCTKIVTTMCYTDVYYEDRPPEREYLTREEFFRKEVNNG